MMRQSLTRSIPRRVFVLAMLCGLGACGTSPPVRYFSLEPAYQEADVEATTQPVVGIGEIRTPNFRYRSQLVTRGQGGEILVHDFERWSEPLDQQFHRVIATNVDSLLDDMTVIAFPYDMVVRPAYRVQGSLERFDVDTSGMGVLIVQWGILDTDDSLVAPARRSRYEARAGEAWDPVASVAAMNELLAAFSRDIATRLEALAP